LIHGVLFDDRLNFIQFLIFAIGNTSFFFHIQHGFYLPVVQIDKRSELILFKPSENKVGKAAPAIVPIGQSTDAPTTAPDPTKFYVISKIFVE